MTVQKKAFCAVSMGPVVGEGENRLLSTRKRTICVGL